MSGFGDFGTIVQSVDLIFMFLNWTTSLFVVIGALMVRGKRMLRDLLIALLLFAVDSWFLLLFTGGVDVDFPMAWVLMPIVLAVFMSMKIDLYTAQSRNQEISRFSIQESTNKFPIGLCFSRLDGHPYLVNARMDELSYRIANQPVKNANEFFAQVQAGNREGICRTERDGIPLLRFPDGRTWSFQKELLKTDGEEILQIVAIDTTELELLLEKRRNENRKLEEINHRLQEYGTSVESLATAKEWLDTKMRIHDTIGQNLMATKYLFYDKVDEARREAIRENWKRTVRMLQHDEDVVEPDDGMKYFLDAARKVGVAVHLDGSIPKTPSVRELIAASGIQMLTNAVRHADARELWVIVEDEPMNYRMLFYNEVKEEAKVGSGNVVEGGGLSGLRKKVEELGGIMSVTSGEYFQVEIIMPKGGRDYV